MNVNAATLNFDPLPQTSRLLLRGFRRFFAFSFVTWREEA